MGRDSRDGERSDSDPGSVWDRIKRDDAQRAENQGGIPVKIDYKPVQWNADGEGRTEDIAPVSYSRALNQEEIKAEMEKGPTDSPRYDRALNPRPENSNPINYTQMQTGSYTITHHIDRIISDREKTHGAISDNAELAQFLREMFRNAHNWELMTAIQRESLDGIATKLARMLCGDPDYPDHIDDVIGWASLYRSSLA